MPKPLPCPFCGEPAETDTQRGYSQWPSGKPGTAIAVYCTQCPADMTLCKEDHRGEPPEYLLQVLVEAWNKRSELALFRDLLAIIHRDGGQHTGRHGLERSAADAREAVVAMLAENERLRDVIEKVAAECHCTGSDPRATCLAIAAEYPSREIELCAKCRCEAALRTDASSTASDYVSKADVRQIALALVKARYALAHPTDGWKDNVENLTLIEAVEPALAIAHKLGVLEDK